MDFSADAITKSLIWYVIPGLALVFFILFPILVLKPEYVSLFLKTAGSFGISFLAIIFGFLLDGLRLYRWRPGYARIKNDFFIKLVGTTKSELDGYYVQSRLSDFAKQNNIAGLNFHHAIWIMHGHLSMLAFVEAAFWILTIIYYFFWSGTTVQIFDTNFPKTQAILIYALFAFIYFLISFRFHKISMEDQNTTNKMFLNFAMQHFNEINTELNQKKSEEKKAQSA